MKFEWRKADPLRGFCIGFGIFILAVLFFLKSNFNVSWDLASYIVSAKNLVEGNGFTDPFGQPNWNRPFYVLQLVLLQLVFGMNIFPVMLLETFWAATYVLAIYLVARALFDERVGIICVCFILLSSGFIFWLPRHIDQIWPALSLLSLFFLLNALQQPRELILKKMLWLAASGVMLGLGFQVKSIAIMLTPVFFMVYLHERGKIRVFGPLISLISMGLIIVIVNLIVITWAGTSESNVLALNRHSSTLAARIPLFPLSPENLYHVAIGFPLKTMQAFFLDNKGPMATFIPVWWLWFPTIPIAVYLGNTRKNLHNVSKSDAPVSLLFWVIFLLAPFSAYVSFMGLRSSQNMLFIAMLVLAVSASLVLIFNEFIFFACSRWPDLKKYNSQFFPLFFIVLAGVILLTHNDKYGKRVWIDAAIHNTFMPSLKKPALDGKKIYDYLNANAEMLQQTSAGLIISTGTLIAYGHTFYSDGSVKLLNLPARQLGDGIKLPRMNDNLLPVRGAIAIGGAPGRAKIAYQPILMTSADAIYDLGEKTGVRLIIIRMNLSGIWLAPFLENKMNAKLIRSFKEGYSKYRLYRFEIPNVRSVKLDISVQPVLFDYFDHISEIGEGYRLPKMWQEFESVFSHPCEEFKCIKTQTN